MKSLLLVALLFLAGWVEAKPSKRSFQHAIRKRPQSVAEIRVRMAANRKAAASGGSKFNAGSAKFRDYLDDFYTANITLGTPAQTFQVQLQTASSNLWVVDASCNSDNCNGETNLLLGPYAKNNTRWTACLASGGPRWPPIQGLLQLLDQPLFTIWLDFQPESIGGAGGLITYGALDSTNCDEPLVYTPITIEGYWQFDVDGFSVGTYSTTTKKAAISDTGTSYILVPNEDFQKILNQTSAVYDFLHMIYVVPCSKVASFPDRRSAVECAAQQVHINADYDDCGLTVDWNIDEDKFSWLLGDVGGERIGSAKARHATG
ncbi:Peptidase A1 domain-containing protein [Aphelenchoides fujianensis]|nr:Peptidase A1 domain-containing protein [Aphelenchoides fujianensis]